MKSAPLIDSTLVGENFAGRRHGRGGERVLVLGVGNLLMGDEGVGIHVLRELEELEAQPGVRLLDGGTGGVNLLLEFGDTEEVILIDATRDGRRAGTVSLVRPRGVGELPRGLSAHDFGVKDLFAAASLLGQLPRVHLFTICVEVLRPMSTELSGPVESAVPGVVQAVRALAGQLARAGSNSP